ncbi:MAG: PQQ-dependent sugar dehydrogenase [Gemmatimonadaceae bacterium]|nr:PQQ-dependent sugar dehydrogenase [Gemmatimonadaceae bacterium]
MTHRIILGLLAIGHGAAPAIATSQQVVRSSQHDFRVDTVVGGLVNPWSIAFLPGGDMLVTERPGRLRIVRKGKLLDQPVAGVPAVAPSRQGGLLDVVLHPQFAANRLVYLAFSRPASEPAATTTVVVRGKFENDALSDVREIFVADSRGATGHYGSRLAFDKSGYLYITMGDRQVPPTGDLEKHPAQDLANHHGTINRVHDDGRVPADNPFVARPGAKGEIWSYGHRNPQGLVVDTASGNVWATEHGPQGGDELNLIRPGSNYGWPVIGYGVNYRTGSAIHAATMREGMEQPVNVWVPSIGTSGLMLYTGSAFPAWRGNLFAGGLVGQQLVRLALDGQRVESSEVILRRTGRVRDVRQGPDGNIYVAIENEQGAPTPILRLSPVPRR